MKSPSNTSANINNINHCNFISDSVFANSKSYYELLYFISTIKSF